MPNIHEHELIKDNDKRQYINVFRTDNSNSSESTSSNPMVDLFYGQYRADGVNEGNSCLL